MPQPHVLDVQQTPEQEVDTSSSMGQQAVRGIDTKAFGQRVANTIGGNSPQISPDRYRAVSSQMQNAPARRTSTLRQLQRSYGNQYVGQIIQAKLTVGQPNDVYEQEADRVADQVMRMPADGASPEVTVSEQIQPLQIQRMCTTCEEEEDRIHRKGTGGAVPTVSPAVESRLDATRGGGQPLSKSVRAQVEPRFGMDFSEVRVHTGGEAASLNRDLKAQAFTRQRDIYFGQGMYQPNSPKGQHLLVHELAHVIQQARINQKFIQRQQLPQLPEQVISGSTHLSRVVQDYRLQNQTLSAGRNLVAVKFSVGGGAPQIKVFENIPGGIAHTEEIMEQFFRDLKGQGAIEVTEVFSERQPCGPSRHDCEGMFLRNKRYRNARVTYAKQYQGLGRYRPARARAEIEASQNRIRATRNLEWDFPNPRQPPPYHERLKGPRQTRGGFFSRLANSFSTLQKNAAQGFRTGGLTAKTFVRGFNSTGRGFESIGKAVPKAFPFALKSFAILGPLFEAYGAYASYKAAEAQVNAMKQHIDAMWALYDELVKSLDSSASNLSDSKVLSNTESKSKPEWDKPVQSPFDRQPVTIYALSERKLIEKTIRLSEIQLKTNYKYVEFYSLTDTNEFIWNIFSIPVNCQQLSRAIFNSIQESPEKFVGYTKQGEYNRLKNILKYQVKAIRFQCLMANLASAKERQNLAKPDGDRVIAYLQLPYSFLEIMATCEGSDINGWTCSVDGDLEGLKKEADDQEAEPLYHLDVEFSRIIGGQETELVYSLTSWIEKIDDLNDLNVAPTLMHEGDKLPDEVCNGNRYPDTSALSFILQHYSYGCYLH